MKRSRQPRESAGSAVEAGSDAVPVRRTAMSLSRRFVQICNAAAADALSEHDLTPLESGVLAYLSRNLGEPNLDQHGLGARMGIDRSHVSLLVDRLVARGFVDRQINPENRRAHILSLTSAGEKLHARTRPRFLAGQQEILSVLRPAEREQLFDMLARVVEANRVLARPGAGRRKRAKPASTSTHRETSHA